MRTCSEWYITTNAGGSGRARLVRGNPQHSGRDPAAIAALRSGGGGALAYISINPSCSAETTRRAAQHRACRRGQAVQARDFMCVCVCVVLFVGCAIRASVAEGL